MAGKMQASIAGMSNPCFVENADLEWVVALVPSHEHGGSKHVRKQLELWIGDDHLGNE